VGSSNPAAAPITVNPTANAPASAAGPTPEPSPWTYDATTKQYWDPRHKHWHGGQAPTPALRQQLMDEYTRQQAATARTSTTPSATSDTTKR
jgi:hypothetical protein